MAKGQPPFSPEQARALARKAPKGGGTAGRSGGGGPGTSKAGKQAFRPGQKAGKGKGRN